MSGYVGPHADGVCAGCGQRLIRVAADDTQHPWCDAPPAGGCCGAPSRALLTLATSGLGVEVVAGSMEGGPPIAVQIGATDLHSPIKRRAAFAEAEARAAALGVELVGDYLTGPRPLGRAVNAREVSLVWQTRTAVPVSEEDAAALWVGRLWGREGGVAVVVVNGQEETYEWPAQWAELLADCAKVTNDGADVLVYPRLRTADERSIPAVPLRWLS